jgi:hypothetical protein
MVVIAGAAGGNAALVRLQGDAPVAGAGSISGTIYNDLNKNGVRDAGEPPLVGWTAYTDRNDNGKVDTGELCQK